MNSGSYPLLTCSLLTKSAAAPSLPTASGAVDSPFKWRSGRKAAPASVVPEPMTTDPHADHNINMVSDTAKLSVQVSPEALVSHAHQ